MSPFFFSGIRCNLCCSWWTTTERCWAGSGLWKRRDFCWSTARRPREDSWRSCRRVWRTWEWRYSGRQCCQELNNCLSAANHFEYAPHRTRLTSAWERWICGSGQCIRGLISTVWQGWTLREWTMQEWAIWTRTYATRSARCICPLLYFPPPPPFWPCRFVHSRKFHQPVGMPVCLSVPSFSKR